MFDFASIELLIDELSNGGRGLTLYDVESAVVSEIEQAMDDLRVVVWWIDSGQGEDGLVVWPLRDWHSHLSQPNHERENTLREKMPAHFVLVEVPMEPTTSVLMKSSRWSKVKAREDY